jgi:hypothetical protein
MIGKSGGFAAALEAATTAIEAFSPSRGNIVDFDNNSVNSRREMESAEKQNG